MPDKNMQPNFQGQTINVGIDVHKKRWAVTVHGGTMPMKTMSMNPSPEELATHLQKHYPGAKYVCCDEAGFSGFWAQRRLEQLGVQTIVVNPGSIPTSGSERIRKTDTVDSRKLARELANESLRGIYVPTPEQEAIRSLCRLRQQYVWDMAGQKNRIKSTANRIGLQLPERTELTHWSHKFMAYIQELEYPTPLDKQVMEDLLQYHELQRNNCAEVLRQIRSLVAVDDTLTKTVRLLMSVPGIGFVTAVTLATEIIDIHRFRHLDQLSCFVGLVPATRSSGSKEVNLGLSRQYQPYLRHLLIESAWIAVRKDPALTAKYLQWAKTKEKKLVIIKIARSLLNRIMTVWKNQTEYVLSVVQ